MARASFGLTKIIVDGHSQFPVSYEAITVVAIFNTTFYTDVNALTVSQYSPQQCVFGIINYHSSSANDDFHHS